MVWLPRRNGSLKFFYAPGPFCESFSLSWQGSTARVTSHIPSLYSNAHPPYPPIIEDDLSYMPSKGWAEMIRKINEVDAQLCSSCGGKMSIISFIDEPKTIDRIIRHLELTFEAERPPPPPAGPGGTPDGSRGEW